MRSVRFLVLAFVLVLAAVAAVSATESEAMRTAFQPVGGQYMSSASALAADGYRVLRVTDAGALYTAPGLAFGGGIDTITSFASTASTGTSSVTLISASASTKVYPTTLFVANQNASTAYLVTIKASGGQALFPPFKLGAGEEFVFYGRGDVSTGAGEGLQLVLDAAGTDVYSAGFYVQK